MASIKVVKAVKELAVMEVAAAGNEFAAIKVPAMRKIVCSYKGGFSGKRVCRDNGCCSESSW